MKNEYRVWGKNSWFLISFPRLGVTLVWDDTKKKYHFYKGIITKNKVDSNEKVIKPIKTTKKWYYYTIILGICVGALSGVIIYDTVIKHLLK